MDKIHLISAENIYKKLGMVALVIYIRLWRNRSDDDTFGDANSRGIPGTKRNFLIFMTSIIMDRLHPQDRTAIND